MKKSWSHKLFLCINSRIGTSRVIDYGMVFCAMWVIFLLGIAVVYLAIPYILFVDGDVAFFSFLSLLLTTVACALAGNWIVALVLRKHRPVVEFPEIKQLVIPMSNWKSFPSDHTTVAFIFALFSTVFFASHAWFTVFAFALAGFVAVGRVFVGVHYPRDILGGIVSAFFFFWIVMYIINPFVIDFFVYLNSLLQLV